MEKSTHPLSRATTTEELDAILSKYFSEESVQHGRAFKPKQSDVIISPYAKCGTTWMQQIVHGLRTRGSMEFDEITAVVPWIDIALDVGWDLDASQVAEPRAYKSHRSWHEIPKGARYIVTFRHYHDAFLSFYRFFEGFYFEPGAISIEDLAKWRWPQEELEEQGYWYHLISWWEQLDNPDVLLLCFEHMRADLPGAVKLIAQFIGIELDDELLEIVLRQSSRDFMLAHRDQFNERHSFLVGGERAGLPPPIDAYKITSGSSKKANHQLPQSLKAEFDRNWENLVTPRFGFKTYEDLCNALQEFHQG